MADLLRVLVVDDSRLVVTQLSRIIEESAHAELVGTAGDGAAAIRETVSLAPDLVLMDIVMPEMDGLSALRIIRAKSPDTRVAMISSVAGAGSNAEEAFRLGACQVIPKPFDPAPIEALLERERARRSA